MTTRPSADDGDWPSFDDVRKANATAKSDFAINILPSSPDSVAVPLVAVPSDFALPKHSSESMARQALHMEICGVTMCAPQLGTYRRALLIITLIIVVWPLAQLATIYDETPRSHVVTAPPTLSLPPRTWTWPAAYPQNATAASKVLFVAVKAIRKGLAFLVLPRDFWGVMADPTSHPERKPTMDGWTPTDAFRKGLHAIDARASSQPKCKPTMDGWTPTDAFRKGLHAIDARASSQPKCKPTMDGWTPTDAFRKGLHAIDARASSQPKRKPTMNGWTPTEAFRKGLHAIKARATSHPKPVTIGSRKEGREDLWLHTGQQMLFHGGFGPIGW